jgi:hypothetical protein
MKECGLGKRKRNEVNYTDAISDARYLQIIDEGGDPEAENQRLRDLRKQGAVKEEESEDELMNLISSNMQ